MRGITERQKIYLYCFVNGAFNNWKDIEQNNARIILEGRKMISEGLLLKTKQGYDLNYEKPELNKARIVWVDNKEKYKEALGVVDFKSYSARKELLDLVKFSLPSVKKIAGKVYKNHNKSK